MQITWILAAAAVLVACKGDGTKSAAGNAPNTQGSGAGSNSGSASTGSGSPTTGSGSPTTGSGSASSVAIAVDPKIAAARCDEPCLFLLETPVDKLGDAYQAVCGKPMAALPFDDCAKLDQIRKCIYAAHGFVFKQKKWKAYATKPWYTPHPEFKPAQISELERANVRELDARAKGCKKGLAVTVADLTRVKAWIGALAAHKPALPRIVTKNSEPASSDELVHFLAEELSGQELALDDNTTVAYEPELPARLVDAIKAPAGAKLRSILIDHGSTFAVDKDNSITEGVQIHMLYDDHDAFLGIDVSHYLYD
jgi:YARHG domain-containing protein